MVKSQREGGVLLVVTDPEIVKEGNKGLIDIKAQEEMMLWPSILKKELKAAGKTNPTRSTMTKLPSFQHLVHNVTGYQPLDSFLA